MRISLEKSARLTGQLKGFSASVFKDIFASWAIETVKALKISASRLRKTAQRKSAWGKTGELARNIAYQLTQKRDGVSTVVGTGLAGKKSVKYAWIQDKGGTIHKKNKMLTIPLGNATGRIANYPDGFFIKSKKGNVLYCQRKGKELVPLFLLRDSVEIPETRWFSGVVDKREPVIREMLRPENVFRRAQEMGAKQ